MELLFPLLIVALLVPMFLGMRRQRREVANQARMQDSLKVGDQVTTTSGLYGTVVSLDPTTVDLEIAEDVITTWLRAAVRDVRPADDFEATPGFGDHEALPGDVQSGETVRGDVERNVEESAEDTERRLNRE